MYYSRTLVAIITNFRRVLANRVAWGPLITGKENFELAENPKVFRFSEGGARLLLNISISQPDEVLSWDIQEMVKHFGSSPMALLVQHRIESRMCLTSRGVWI
jgi:hypothetical protein